LFLLVKLDILRETDMSDAEEMEEFVNDPLVTMPLDTMLGVAGGGDMPADVKIVFTLLSTGMGRERICALLDISDEVIDSYLSQHDRDGLLVDAMAARRVFMAGSYEAIATYIAGSITENEIKKLAPLQRVSLAEKCMKIANSFSVEMPKAKPKVDDALKKLGGE